MNISIIKGYIKELFSDRNDESKFHLQIWTIVTLALLALSPVVMLMIWNSMNLSGAGINLTFLILFIIQVIMFYYVPASVIYGIVRVMNTGNIEATICHPFLGIGRLSPKKGYIIWSMQLIFAGAVVMNIVEWIRHGVSPLIPF